ncbi:MAG: hypothetical protein JNN13_06725 [Planctomycetes bacterium]|nr:hypothetical protein [Planctomycetota bacterium]
MLGGLAVRGNLLGVTYSASRGHVFLFDLEARQRVSAWTLPAGRGGYADAGGLAIDEHFHLYVADPHGDRVCHFSAFGRHLGDFGLPPPVAGDAGRDRPGVLDRPHAVAVFDDRIYVVMGEQPRRRGVQCFDRRGAVLRPLASGGDVERAFGAPRAICADGAGVVVADTLRGTLQRFRPDGGFIAELRCAEAGALARPFAVARLADGSLLAADRGDRAGLVRFAPTGRELPVGDLGTHSDGVVALANDAAGRVYVLDRAGERVCRFAADLRFDAVIVDLAEHLDDFPSPP